MKKSLILLLILMTLLVMPAEAGKKGVGGPGGCPDIPDLPMLYNVLKVDWAYTWATCLWPMPSVEYVPMARSALDPARAQQVVAHYGAGGYWLVGNEPDDKKQDNLTPMKAAEQYGKIVHTILSVDPTARIIIGGWKDPSLYTRTMAKAQFEAAWMSLYNEDVRDVTVGFHTHAYCHPFSGETQQNAIDRVQRQILAWKEENPGRELWITEYGNLWRADVETMRQMTTWLDANVDRYAFFYFGSPPPVDAEWEFTSLYTDPWPLPMLTELGEAFIGLPGAKTRTPTQAPTKTKTPIQTPTKTLTPAPTPTLTPLSSSLFVLVEPRLDMTVSPDPAERDMQNTESLITLTNHVRTIVIAILLMAGALGGTSLVAKLKNS